MRLSSMVLFWSSMVSFTDPTVADTQALKIGLYVTGQEVVQYLTAETGRQQALAILRDHHASRVCIEFYRSGLTVDKKLLTTVRDFFVQNNIQVIGGIATVPGDGVGVAQQGKLGWFNWQNAKTQHDLTSIMIQAAAIFDSIVIDDFLCTADTSAESQTAKGSRSWPQYRRDLLTELAQQIFIAPTRRINPDIELIIKYPQWYDRFHLFGYDVDRKSALFDRVWVGTETRGAHTQRFGFVQPFEGFVNFRWLASVSDKTTCAWFDHGDCEAIDFIDQAYQSVLAGAQELTLFSYAPFVNRHGGHALLRSEWPRLVELASVIDAGSETAVYGYKPVNSDAGGDLYLFDYIGMLGIPFVPTAQWPEQAAVILLPTQAASDAAIADKILAVLSQSKRIIVTAGFLNRCQNKKLLELAGVRMQNENPFSADAIACDGIEYTLQTPLQLAGDLVVTDSQELLTVARQNEKVPFLTSKQTATGQICVLNSHTFSQQDFDRIGEVLLAPTKLGLVDLPDAPLQALRQLFIKPLGIELDAPGRVTCQSMGQDNWFMQNYNDVPVKIKFRSKHTQRNGAKEVWNRALLVGHNGFIRAELEPRGRMWIR